MKIRPVETELFHADGRKDGQTYMTKLIVAFRNFEKAPNSRLVYTLIVNTTKSKQCHSDMFQSPKGHPQESVSTA